jgi:hypothetical protein
LPKLDRIVTLLHTQRSELLKELDAVDKALAALEGAGVLGPPTPAGEETAPDGAAAVVPRRVKSKRMLSDSHKEALASGRRKAREAKDVAKGLARELPDESFVPAIGTDDRAHPPRLVKRQIKR